MDVVDKAALFAVKVHTGQRRKLRDIPFIVHPMEVAAIVASISEERETIAAALLHDTVEDTDTDADEILAEFGERVAFLVASETEDKMRDRSEEETWRVRKEKSLICLTETDDREVKILWLADKLANMRSLLPDYEKYGDDMWNSFHQKDKKEQEWYYRTIADAVSELSDTTAYKEYIRILDKVFS